MTETIMEHNKIEIMSKKKSQGNDMPNCGENWFEISRVHICEGLGTLLSVRQRGAFQD